MRDAMNGAAMHQLRPVPQPRCVIRDADRDDVLAFQTKLRPEDEAEILGLGVSVRKALWRGYRNSVRCRVAYIDGEPAAIWGVCVNLQPGQGPLSNQGVPWLHTTAAVERLPVTFLREARREVAAMQRLYPHLENHVAANYSRAVRFLHLLGFTVDPPQPVGLHGAMYCRFHKG